MVRLIAIKLLQGLLTLVVSSVIIFFGVRALPGDPARALAGENQDAETIAAIRAQLGLDEPLPVQYAVFAGNALRGDFGTSLRSGAQVSDMVAATLPVTAQLAFLAMAIASLGGITLGAIAAYWRGRWPAGIANGLALLGMSVPNFWMGLLGILLFAISWQVLPASGYVSPFASPLDALRHLLMPALVLAFQLMAVLLRQTRSSMIEALDAEFMTALRSHGVGEGALVVRHGLRNSLIVVVTLIGLELGGLLSGAVITERLFAIPGFGKLTVDAIAQRDYPVVQAAVLITVVIFVVVNLLVDLLYGVIDPRIRTGGVR